MFCAKIVRTESKDTSSFVIFAVAQSILCKVTEKLEVRNNLTL